MQPTPAIAIARRRFAVRLSLLYAAVFAILGAFTPFFPLWLKARGLDAAWIGLVMATPTLARLTAVPLITHAAERRHAVAQTIMITSALTVAGFALLDAMPGPVLIGAMLVLTACAWTPTIPLTDAYALRGVALHEVNYGPIRLWGSAAYIAGVLVAGAVASLVDAGRLIWIMVAIAALGAIAALMIEPLPPPSSPALAPAASRKPERRRPLMAVIVAAALIQGSHAAYYSFSSIAWQAEGLGGGIISALWSICIVAEIALFAVSPRLGLASSTLIVIGGLGGAVRWVATAWEPSVAWLGLVQTMHALSFGATHLGTMGLLARLVPGRAIATAQGGLTAAIGLVTAGASIVCGDLFARYGQSIYFGMAIMAAAGGLLMLATRRLVEPSPAT